MNAATSHRVRWLQPNSPGPDQSKLKQPDEPRFLTLQMARKRGWGQVERAV